MGFAEAIERMKNRIAGNLGLADKSFGERLR